MVHETMPTQDGHLGTNRHCDPQNETPFQRSPLGSGPGSQIEALVKFSQCLDPETISGIPVWTGSQRWNTVFSSSPERNQTLGCQAESPEWKNIPRTHEVTPPFSGHPRHKIQTEKPVLLPPSHLNFKSRGASLRVFRFGLPTPHSYLLSKVVSKVFGPKVLTHMTSRMGPRETHDITGPALLRKPCPSQFPKMSRLGENCKAPDCTPIS